MKKPEAISDPIDCCITHSEMFLYIGDTQLCLKDAGALIKWLESVKKYHEYTSKKKKGKSK